MSHYTVLCVTQTSDEAELAELLDPYDENGHLELHTDEDGEDHNRNPRAKWDWWRVGGRWAGSLLRADGAQVDQLARSQLAADAMRVAASQKAVETWATMDALCRDLPLAKMPDDVIADLGGREGLDWDRYRSVMFSQPRVEAIRKITDWGAVDLLRDYQVVGREAYIARERGLAIPGYAMLTAEAWIARGAMGWFGMGSDGHESSVAYAKQANEIIDNMPGSWWLTMVDCHI